MKRRRAVIFLVLITMGATAAAFTLWARSAKQPSALRVISEEEKATVPSLLAGPWVQDPDARVGKVKALHGADENRVLSELGEPNETFEFPVEEFYGEFRIELWNTYPPDDTRSRGVRILEWQWRYKEFSFAVWFHKVDGRWIVLDTCRWKKGIAF